MVEDTHSAAISALQQFRAARLQGNLEKIQAIRYAQQCLRINQIQAGIIEKTGDTALEILREANLCHSNLIILGSYGYYPIKEIALGSTVDEILRKYEGAVLICR